MDKYYKPLLSDEYILLYLKQFINEISLCRRIINIKKKNENKEIYEYYNDRWENISKEHFFLRENQNDKFSYIFNSEKYVIKKDHKFSFYDLTGISYQVLELIYELIHIFNDITIIDKKEWINNEDKLYGKLSYLIMKDMRDHNKNNKF